MTTGWIPLLGLLGIVMGSCCGFSTNRSDAVSAIWPGPTFNTNRRTSMAMFRNGKIHAAHMKNILRGPKKIARQLEDKEKEEKCSSCLDSPRIRRSDEIIRNQNDKNSSRVKESTIASSTFLDLKTSDVTLKVTSDVSLDDITNVSSIVTSNGFSDVTAKITPDISSSNGTLDISPLNVTSDISSDVTSEVSSEITSDESSKSAAPRNVVLVLVEDNGPHPKATWKKFGAMRDFEVQTFLQNCGRTEISEGSKFLLTKSIVSGKKDGCECNRLLREKVDSLLSWARDVKEMATGVVSTTNFSITSTYRFEKLPRQVTKDLGDNDEVNDLKLDARRPRADLRAKNWQSIETQKRSSLSGSTSTFVGDSATKPDGVNGYDGMWDVLNMFSRIRMAFFHILLESLGNIGSPENDLSGRKSLAVKPTAAELVSDTIRELKSVVIDEGFVMFVAAPASELSAVLQILQSEVSAKDTLLAVAGMCSESNEPVPFFANGSGAKALQEARTVSDLPESIRSVISNGCYGNVCNNKRREEPHILSTVDMLSLPDDLPHKRVIRAKEEDESTTSTADDKTTKDSGETETSSDEKTDTQEIEKRSGAPMSRVDNVAAILGIVTSISATLALNS